MKRSALLLAVGLLLVGCRPGRAPQPRVTFSEVHTLPHTPPQNQGPMPVCWAYAMVSLLESDAVADGDSIRYSATDVARTAYAEALADGTLPRGVRGTGFTLLRLAGRYGLARREAVRGVSPEGLKTLLATRGRLTGNAARKRIDAAFGPEPPRTPWRNGRYEAFTCLPDSPRLRAVVLDVPDNRERARFVNLSLEALLDTVRATLARGRTLAWEGDVSEPTYSARLGVATWPVRRRAVNERERRRDLRAGQTTDDHMMHLVGTATGSDGRRYFLLKNSYGRHGRYDGYVFMDENYFRMKTLAVYRRKADDRRYGME